MSDGTVTSISTAERDIRTGRFLSGNTGGPGRKIGSRNRLGEQFVADLHQAWREHGPKIIAEAIAADPAGVLKVYSSLLPKLKQVDGEIAVTIGADIQSFADAFAVAVRAIGGNEVPQLSKRRLIELEAELIDDDDTTTE